MKYTYKEITKLYDEFRTHPINNKLHKKKVNEKVIHLCKYSYYMYPQIDFSELHHHLYSLDCQQVKDISIDNFMDEHIMVALTCIVQSILYDKSSSIVQKQFIVRYWFNNLKRIGAASLYGIALLASLNCIDDVFVIKTPKDRRKYRNQPRYEDITHDTFVGLFGTNLLRKIIPNIAYVFGGFELNPLYMSQTDELLTWGLAGISRVHYVIYEKIFPSIDFKRTIRTCNVETVINLYLQVVITLGIAHNMINFSHNDLHAGNVLVRDIKYKSFDIFYPAYGGTSKDIYLHSSSIATFIDLGLSHITYDSKEYGPFGYERYGINCDSSFIMGDAFRLLMFLYEASIQYQNKPISDTLSKIFCFFSDDPIELYRKNLSPYYILPPKDVYVDKHISELVDHIIHYFPVITKEMISDVPKSTNIVKCSSSEPVKINDIFNIFTIDRDISPSNCLEFYHLMYSNINPSDAQIVLVNGQNTASMYLEKEIRNMSVSITDLLDRLIILNQTTTKFTNPSIHLYQKTSDTTVEDYFKHIEILTRIWDEFLCLNIIFEAVDYMSWQYGIMIDSSKQDFINIKFFDIIRHLRLLTDNFITYYSTEIKYSIDLFDITWMRLFERYMDFFKGLKYPHNLDILQPIMPHSI